MKYVIIGGGVAAVEAAVAIRKNAADAEITLCWLRQVILTAVHFCPKDF